MSSKQLGKLEELAGKRADQSRSVLEREFKKLQQIDHHRSELRTINQEYQEALVGNVDVAPQQLAHRRAFVEQLTIKLDELDVQSDQKRDTVKQKALEHKQHTAQHTAIEIVNNHRIDADKLATKARHQKQLDEVARGQHFERNRTDMEQEND